MDAFVAKLFGIASAAAETAGAPAGAPNGAIDPTQMSATGSLVSTIVMLVLMFAVFYFLLIRPQKKKDKKVKEMLDSLKNGDRVCTIGGIYGTIVSIKDDTITLSVGNDNVKLVFARWAIRNVEEIQIENDSEVLN